MMKWKVAKRLAITATAAALLLLTLAYWWLNNLVHELAGTMMFALVIWHIYLNRTWMMNLSRGRYDLRRRLIVALHAGLMINILLLLGSSLAISQSAFTFLQIPDTVMVRDLHWLAAYWLVITLGIHLGLHWSRVMALIRSGLRITGQSVAGLARCVWWHSSLRPLVPGVSASWDLEPS